MSTGGGEKLGDLGHGRGTDHSGWSPLPSLCLPLFVWCLWVILLHIVDVEETDMDVVTYDAIDPLTHIGGGTNSVA